MCYPRRAEGDGDGFLCLDWCDPVTWTWKMDAAEKG